MVAQMFEFLATSQAEDGFFLNLSTLLLKMCQPFMDPLSPKLLKINPQYCAVPVGSDAIGQESTGLHVVGLDSETRLVAPPDEEQITLKITKTFGFVTECFFMTHHCLSIGKWMKRHTPPLLLPYSSLSRCLLLYSFIVAGFINLFTANSDKSETLQNSFKILLVNPKKWIVLFKSSAKEVWFEWQDRRISSRNSEVKMKNDHLTWTLIFTLNLADLQTHWLLVGLWGLPAISWKLKLKRPYTSQAPNLYSDQVKFLGNCPPTTPLSHHFAQSKK